MNFAEQLIIFQFLYMDACNVLSTPICTVVVKFVGNTQIILKVWILISIIDIFFNSADYCDDKRQIMEETIEAFDKICWDIRHTYIFFMFDAISFFFTCGAHV